MDIAIAALLLWMITAGVGVYLLMATITAKRAHTHPGTAAGSLVPAGTAAAGTAGPVTAVPTATGYPREPPPLPHVKVIAGPDEHPLLEFSHPALAITGLGTWLAYVATHFVPFAWFSFTVLVIAIVAGLAWLILGARARKRRAGGRPRTGPGVSHRLVLLHGLSASVTFLLAVLTMLVLMHV